mmetsp:Transcript_55258/g.131744  ORF Transcript_55258/g.131744 Transcript_55258/m.131744 type:complete len:247 (-) Transcript_55258:448-1188(-)
MSSRFLLHWRLKDSALERGGYWLGEVGVPRDRVLLVGLVLVVNLPPASREDVLVPVVPLAIHDLASMALVLLHPNIVVHTDIFVHIEVEQWTGLTTGFLFDQIVESDVVRNDQVLLDINEGLCWHTSELRKICFGQITLALGQELPNGEALLYHDSSTVTRAIPVGVCHLQFVLLCGLLLLLVLIYELHPLPHYLQFTVLIVQEGCVDSGILAQGLSRCLFLLLLVIIVEIVVFLVLERELLRIDF